MDTRLHAINILWSRYRLIAHEYPLGLKHCILTIKDHINQEIIQVAACYLIHDTEFMEQFSAQDRRTVLAIGRHDQSKQIVTH